MIYKNKTKNLKTIPSTFMIKIGFPADRLGPLGIRYWVQPHSTLATAHPYALVII
jgi:hypothetical protein